MSLKLARFGTAVWIKFLGNGEESKFRKVPINYCNVFENLEGEYFSVRFRSHDWSVYEKLSEMRRCQFEFAARNRYGDEIVGVQGLVILNEKRCIAEVESLSIFEFEVQSVVMHPFVEPAET